MKLSAAELKSMYNAAVIEEKHAAIREDIAKNETRKDRLLIDISNLNTLSTKSCGMKMRSIAHWRACYSTDICNTQIACPIRRTCDALNSLTNKKTRKGNGVHSGKVNSVSIKRSVSRGIITLSFPNQSVQGFKGDNWAKATKKIREYFKSNPIEGLTTSAVAGFTHKGKGDKWEKIFNG